MKVASQGRRVAEADYEIRVQSQNVMCDTQRGITLRYPSAGDRLLLLTVTKCQYLIHNKTLSRAWAFPASILCFDVILLA